jgi:hypothetical protein
LLSFIVKFISWSGQIAWQHAAPEKFVLLEFCVLPSLSSSIVHNSHTDLIFEFGAPLFSRGVFSRFASLSYLILDGLEANVLEPCSCAWDDKDPTVA